MLLPPKKRAGVFFPHAFPFKRSTWKTGGGLFTFPHSLSRSLSISNYSLSRTEGKEQKETPKKSRFIVCCGGIFLFLRYEALTHFGAPQTNTTIQSEKVEYDVDATEGEKTKAINVTGPDGSNVLGSKRLYRKHKGGGSGGPDGEEAPGEPEAH